MPAQAALFELGLELRRGAGEDGVGAEMHRQPVLSLTIEVKQLGIQPVRESVFAVPASYKLVKQP